MRRLVRILAIFAGFLAIAAAEEFPLQPIDRPVIAGEVRCLPFFVTTSFGGKVAEQVIFWYKDANGTIQREMVYKTRTAIQVSDEAKTPTYQKISEDGQNGASFKLSRADYDKAHTCLPPEQTKPAQ